MQASIYPHPTNQDIAALAYDFWEQNGEPAGKDVDFWLHAEQLLLSSAPQLSVNDR